MHQIGIVGLSYRHAPAQDLARFALARSELPLRLPRLREALGAAEIVYLGTCNRVEVLFAMPAGRPAGDCRTQVFRALTGSEPAPGEAAARLRARVGEAAVEHLLLVACGLDSAQAGEQEITAQLRAAWDAAREAAVAGPLLDRLLGEALSLAHEVGRIACAERAPSLAELGAELVLGRLEHRAGPVALIGVSAMTRRCGRRLHAAGVPLLVVNRSVDAARECAHALSARVLSLEQFRAHPPALAAAVLATGAREPVLGPAELAALAAAARTAGPDGAAPAPLIVDFGMPPNVDPCAAQCAGFERAGMDELVEIARRRRGQHLLRLAPVRAAVDERLARLRNELTVRALGPRLGELRERFERIATAELERLLATELHGLDAAQCAALQRWAAGLARRLAHLPLSGIRAAAEHAGADAVDAFFREARLKRDRADETLR